MESTLIRKNLLLKEQIPLSVDPVSDGFVARGNKQVITCPFKKNVGKT